MGTVCRIDCQHQKKCGGFIPGIAEIQHIGIAPVKQLPGDGGHDFSILSDPVIPTQKVTLHLPAPVVHLIVFAEEGELFPDGSADMPILYDFKGGQQCKQLLPDISNLGIGLVSVFPIDMYLVSQGKEGAPHFVFCISVFIKYIIAVRPGEYSLPDPKLHNTASFEKNHTTFPAALQEKAPAPNLIRHRISQNLFFCQKSRIHLAFFI